MEKTINNFCGAHLKKWKNIFTMRKMEAHNLRNEEEVELGNNIDKERKEFNNVFKYNGFDEIEKTYYRCLKKCKRKPRKDHIMCLDYVFFRSDCFTEKIEEAAFRECCLDFFASYFKNCPYAVYEHNDEGVQHFHVLVIPHDGEKFIGSNFCGKRQDLIKLQDLFAEYCMNCNLERGIAKSKDKHKDIGDYYKEQCEALEKEYNLIYQEAEAKLEHLINVNDNLDNIINNKRLECNIENLENYKKGVIQYFNALQETLKQDDGSEYFQGVRACFEYFKNLLIELGVLHNNKDKNINR